MNSPSHPQHRIKTEVNYGMKGFKEMIKEIKRKECLPFYHKEVIKAQPRRAHRHQQPTVPGLFVYCSFAHSTARCMLSQQPFIQSIIQSIIHFNQQPGHTHTTGNS
ncbi:MAG: hypothetical protein IPF54_26770 [Draconibacterium sp.]|nr:hypothetical protein [Draconibacterium sp.]